MNDAAHTVHNSAGGILNPSTYVQPNQGAVYHIDRVQPTVVSIVPALGAGPVSPATSVPATSNPTNSEYVDYTITFSKPVVNLYKGSPNFPLILAASGLANTQIMAIAAVAGSNYTQYNVEAFTGSGSGSIGLNLADPGQELRDAVGNPLTGPGSGNTVFVGSPTYTIDRTQPVASISLAAGQASTTSSSPINFTVIFSKPVTGFTSSGVNLSFSSLTGLTATVTGSGTTYNVAVTGMTGTGTVVAWVMSNVAQDSLGNLDLSSGIAKVNYTSTVAVTVAKAGGQADPTNAGPINFTVTFNQPVVSFTAADLSFAGSTAPGNLVGTITGSGPVYNVAVSGMTATGRVLLTIPANAVHNAAGYGNTASTGTADSAFYDIDAPVAVLDNPTAGATVSNTVLDAQGYIDVSYSAQVGVGVNTATITDAGQEFTLSGAAAAGVVVNGAAIPLGNDEFQYNFTGTFSPGTVTVNFVASSYQDNAGNYDKAQTFSFTVVQGAPVTTPSFTLSSPASGSYSRRSDGSDPMDRCQCSQRQHDQPGLRHDHQLGQPEVDRDQPGGGRQWQRILQLEHDGPGGRDVLYRRLYVHAVNRHGGLLAPYDRLHRDRRRASRFPARPPAATPPARRYPSNGPLPVFPAAARSTWPTTRPPTGAMPSGSRSARWRPPTAVAPTVGTRRAWRPGPITSPATCTRRRPPAQFSRTSRPRSP